MQTAHEGLYTVISYIVWILDKCIVVSSVSCGIFIGGLQKGKILFLVILRNLLRHVSIENFETNSSHVGQPIRIPDQRLNLNVI